MKLSEVDVGSSQPMKLSDIPDTPAMSPDDLSRAQSFRSTTMGAPPSGDQAALFNKKSEIETRLRAAGKNPADDPEWQQAARALGGAVTSNAVSAGILGAGAGAGEGAARVIPNVLSKGVALYSRATGATAKTAAEELRAQTTAQAAKVAADREAEAAAYQKKLDSIENARKQLSTQPATAEARAHGQVLQHPLFAQEQARVLEGIRSRVRASEQSYIEAGHSVQTAKALAAQDEQKVADAESAVRDMEKQFLAMPQVSAEQFGAKIRDVTQQLHDKYTQIRSTQSGYKEAIESAGNYQRIDTRPILDDIDTHLKGIRNPSLQGTLDHIKELLTSDERPALTLRSADSLRKYLDSIIQSKTITTARGPLAVDKEALYVVRDIKKQLVKAATESWQPYREALGRWRTLSRPLDIVERKGALKRSLDVDPVSTDYATTESQVVGQVIQQARTGNPVFTRLLSESPELRESARLYFTRDLFGKEAVPSDASLRTWLKANEAPLKQLGLYDEFRNMRVAKETAQRAVADAKSSRQLSAADIKKAEAEEQSARKNMESAARLRDAEKKRIEQANKSVTQPEELVKRSAKRAKTASQRLTQQSTETARSVDAKQKIADRYRQFETQMRVARPAEMPANARSFVDRLRKDGLIGDSAHTTLIRQIQSAEDTAKDASDLRKRMLHLLAGGAAAIGIPVIVRKVGGL